VTTVGSEEVNQTTVSVIIPCFNLGLYIDEAVDSVLAQTHRDFEIIIVNDGSTDPGTNALLQGYDRPKTRVLTTENRGLAAARNLGIRSARGAYVSALDADDRFERTYLEKAVGILESRHEIAFVSPWLETFGDETWVWRQERCDLPALLAECTVCTASVVRASALAAIGGYDESMPAQGYEDWDLWIGLVERGFQGAIIPEILFHYRRRAGSMSAICCVEPAHGILMQYLMEKHRHSYDRHALDVLLHKESQAGDQLRKNREIERHLTTWLEPLLEARRKELQRLRTKLRSSDDGFRSRLESEESSRSTQLARQLDAERERVRDLAAELSRMTAEVAALRSSKSWRITAPVRALQDLLMRLEQRSK
jgi:glycosyltransferase involved in cell wall biosynthesis